MKPGRGAVAVSCPKCRSTRAGYCGCIGVPLDCRRRRCRSQANKAAQLHYQVSRSCALSISSSASAARSAARNPMPASSILYRIRFAIRAQGHSGSLPLIFHRRRSRLGKPGHRRARCLALAGLLSLPNLKCAYGASTALQRPRPRLLTAANWSQKVCFRRASLDGLRGRGRASSV